MKELKLGKLTDREQGFLNAFFDDQEVDPATVYAVVQDLGSLFRFHRLPLVDVHMNLEGGLHSWRGLTVAGDFLDHSVSQQLVRLEPYTERVVEESRKEIAEEVYYRIGQLLDRPTLFQGFGVREVPVRPLDVLENNPQIDHYVLLSSMLFGRKEGTRYKKDLPVGIELHVHDQVI